MAGRWFPRAAASSARAGDTGAALAALCLLVISCLPLGAFAQEPPQAAACTACHGPGGNAQIPTYPSIAGQPKLFIENQLVLIREGLRDVPEMRDVVKDMTDETIVALANYYTKAPVKVAATAVDAAKAKAGAEIASKALCGSCHLPDYRGQNQVPRLAGQNEAFLNASLKAFRDNPGPGRDTIMAATLRGMSDTDLVNLAHYFATYRP